MACRKLEVRDATLEKERQDPIYLKINTEIFQRDKLMRFCL